MKSFSGLLMITALVLLSFSTLCFASTEIVKIGSDVDIPAGTKVNTAVAVLGSVSVSGEVRDDVVSIGGSVYLSPTASVGKNVVAVGGKVVKEQGAKVAGNITEVISPEIFKHAAFPGIVGAVAIVGLSMLAFLAFIGLLALVCLIAAIFPKNIGYVSAAIEKDPWKMFWLGVLNIILIPIICLVLAVSLIGIPLIPLYVILLSVAFLLGYIALVQIIGKRILKAFKMENKPMVIEVLTGAIVIGLVCLVPILGWLIKMIVASIGLGGVLVTKLATRQV